MMEIPSRAIHHQERVDSHFGASASYWEEVYEARGVLPLIYQRRQATALSWIARLQLPPASCVLEIGCGAGFLSTALAHAGYSVTAIDPAPAMLTLTRQNAARRGLASRLRVMGGDAHALPFAPECFHVVVALGVIPWLHEESAAVKEMGRVLKPGGYLLLTADNRNSLTRLLDPFLTPSLSPLKRTAKRMLQRLGLRRSPYQLTKHHSPAEIDSMLAASGLVKLRSATVGFGPFTFCGRGAIPESIAIRIDQRLQRFADLPIPLLRMTGFHYVVLATKTGGHRARSEPPIIRSPAQ